MISFSGMPRSNVKKLLWNWAGKHQSNSAAQIWMAVRNNSKIKNKNVLKSRICYQPCGSRPTLAVLICVLKPFFSGRLGSRWNGPFYFVLMPVATAATMDELQRGRLVSRRKPRAFRFDSIFKITCGRREKLN